MDILVIQFHYTMFYGSSGKKLKIVNPPKITSGFSYSHQTIALILRAKCETFRSTTLDNWQQKGHILSCFLSGVKIVGNSI